MDPDDTDTPLSLPAGIVVWSTCDADVLDCGSPLCSSACSWPGGGTCSAWDLPAAGEPAAEDTELGDRLWRRGEGVAVDLELEGVCLNGEAGPAESVCRVDTPLDWA